MKFLTTTCLLALIFSCSSLRNEKKIDLVNYKLDNGKDYSFYLKTNLGDRSPSSVGNAVVHPFKALVRSSDTAGAEKIIMDYINPRIGGTNYKSLDELSKTEESILTDLYIKVIGDPTFIKAINFDSALKKAGTDNDYHKAIQDILSVDNVEMTTITKRFMIEEDIPANASAVYTNKRLLAAAFSNTDSTGSLQSVLKPLQAGFKKAALAGDVAKKMQYKELYQLALINAAETGTTFIGKNCPEVLTKSNVIAGMQRLFPTAKKAAPNADKFSIYRSVAGQTYLDNLDPSELDEQAKINWEHIGPDGKGKCGRILK